MILAMIQTSLNFKVINFVEHTLGKELQMAQYTHDFTDIFAQDESKLGV